MAYNTFGHSSTPSLVAGLVATGTNQATAFQLGGAGRVSIQEVDTVASGTGVVLPPIVIPTQITVINAGGSTLAVYPQTDAQIGGAGLGVAVTLAPGNSAIYMATGTGQWRQQTAGSSTGGSGTVTSVAMTVPSILAVAGSPITTGGTLAVTMATESANTVLAGPTTGSAAAPTFRSIAAADLPGQAASTLLGNPTGSPAVPSAITLGTNLSFAGSVLNATGSGGGGVSSVAMTVPGIMSVGGSPITTSGTLALSLNTASPNLVLAGPNSGSSATPTFRSMVLGDLPTIPTVTLLGNATGGTAVPESITLGTGLSFAGTVLNASASGSGTVTTVSVASANGFTGSVANATTTPAITLTTSITGILKGNGTAISAASAGTDYLTSVVTSNITAANVTYAKIQNVAAHALLGNPTGSAAAPSEITLGSGLSFSGSTITASGGGGSAAAQTVQTGLKAYFRFDEAGGTTVTDANSNNGVYTATAAATCVSATGIINQHGGLAASFDGSAQYYELPTASTALLPTSGQQMTYAGWAKFAADAAGTIFGAGGNGNPQQVALNYTPAAVQGSVHLVGATDMDSGAFSYANHVAEGMFSIFIKVNAFPSSGNGYWLRHDTFLGGTFWGSITSVGHLTFHVFQSGGAANVSFDLSGVTTGVWHHIGMRWSQSGTAQEIYFDGSVVATGTLATTWGDGDVSPILISDSTTMTSAADFELSDFALWYTTSGVTGDMTGLAASTLTPATTSAPADLWWKFNGTTGATPSSSDAGMSSGGHSFSPGAGTITYTADSHYTGSTPGQLAFQVYNSPVSIDYTTPTSAHYIECYWDGTLPHVAIDGGAFTAGSAPTVGTPADKLRFGADQHSSPTYFHGILDGWAVANRSWTSGERTFMYNSGAGFDPV